MTQSKIEAELMSLTRTKNFRCVCVCLSVRAKLSLHASFVFYFHLFQYAHQSIIYLFNFVNISFVLPSLAFTSIPILWTKKKKKRNETVCVCRCVGKSASLMPIASHFSFFFALPLLLVGYILARLLCHFI